LNSERAASIARKDWLTATNKVSELCSVLAYAKARWNIACRLGDTPTCGKWRDFCSKLEGYLDIISNRLDSIAWSQTFTYAPSAKSAKESMVATHEFMGDRKFRYSEHPHSLAEIAGDTEDGEDYVYDDAKEYVPVSTWRSVMWQNEKHEPSAPNEPIEEQDDDVPSTSEIWVVRTDDGVYAFKDHDSALAFAQTEVEDGQARALVYRASMTEAVEAVVHRTIQVTKKQ
jgi:hypothetical protein